MNVLKITYKEIKKSRKLAMFDLDDTLIRYNHTESAFLLPNVEQKLATLRDYTIIVISNQLEVFHTENDKNRFKKKLNEMFEKINVPMVVYCGLSRDFARKPGTGILETFLREYDYPKMTNDCNLLHLDTILKKYGIEIENNDEDKWFLNYFDYQNSFYVGDAAGRIGDHSDCDLKLAINMGVDFYTPEMFFNDSETNYKINYIDISPYRLKAENVRLQKNGSLMQYNESDGKYENVFIYGKGNYSGKRFYGRQFVDAVNVFYNCKDLTIIRKLCNKKTTICYYLDYSNNVLSWLKTFCQLTGKKTHGGNRTDKFADYKGYFANIEKVPFVYDDSSYTEEEKKVARMVL